MVNNEHGLKKHVIMILKWIKVNEGWIMKKGIRIMIVRIGELTLVKVDQKVNYWPKSTFGQHNSFLYFLLEWTFLCNVNDYLEWTWMVLTWVNDFDFEYWWT